MKWKWLLWIYSFKLGVFLQSSFCKLGNVRQPRICYYCKSLPNNIPCVIVLQFSNCKAKHHFPQTLQKQKNTYMLNSYPWFLFSWLQKQQETATWKGLNLQKRYKMTDKASEIYQWKVQVCGSSQHSLNLIVLHFFPSNFSCPTTEINIIQMFWLHEGLCSVLQSKEGLLTESRHGVVKVL